MSAWTVIAHSTTIASAMLEITGLTLTGYKAVRGILTQVSVVSDNTSPVLQLYLAGSLVTSGYNYIINTRVGGSSTDHRGSGEANMWICDWSTGVSNNANAAFMCDFTMGDPGGSGLRRFLTCRSTYSAQGTNVLSTLRGINGVGNNGAVTGFRLKSFSGSGIAAARLTLLGLS